MFNRIAIMGVGLLGGSLGQACRQEGLAREVIGVGRNAPRLALACELGAIDRYTLEPEEAFAQADLIVLAAPVQTIIDLLPLAARAARPGAIVTDIGSSKGSIVHAARAAFADSAAVFLGSHPMAGSERTGVRHSRPDLYQGAPCYLTPTSETPDQALRRLAEFWQALGAVVTTMPADHHDRIVAQLSHLPHAVAVAVMMALEAGEEEMEAIAAMAGPGLLDTTRVAAGSVDMWRDIFRENREPVLEALDQFAAALTRLRQAIATDDVPQIERILDTARNLRLGIGRERPANVTPDGD